MEGLYRNNRIKMFAAPNVSLTAIKASGTKIISKEFGELIDFESGCWAAVLGHCNDEIVETISAKAGLLFHTHQFFDTENPGALVKELTKAADLKGSYRGTFLSSGSEAVSLGVTLAQIITGRCKKLSFSISYLGTSPELRMPRDPHQWMDLDIEECLNCVKDWDCRICNKFNTIDFSEMAAFVLEPGNSGGLVLCPPEKLITFLTEAIRNAGGYVVVNEVTTGFGRTGKWFGFQHYDVFDSEAKAPDFIAMGKGLGNGYPISGLLVRSSLGEIIKATGFRYLQSHTDDPLGCIVARKVIEIMVKEDLVIQGNKTGDYLRSKLIEVFELTGGIREVRGRGMMNVVVLNKNHKAEDVFEALLKKGIFTGYSEAHNYIHLYPPLTINHQEIDELCSSLALILASAGPI